MEPMSKTQARKKRAEEICSPIRTPEKRATTPPQSSGEKSQYEYYYDEEDDSPQKSTPSPQYVMVEKPPPSKLQPTKIESREPRNAKLGKKSSKTRSKSVAAKKHSPKEEKRKSTFGGFFSFLSKKEK